jgi:hypothetical protein
VPERLPCSLEQAPAAATAASLSQHTASSCRRTSNHMLPCPALSCPTACRSCAA